MCVEQSHLEGTVPNTAACHHKIAAPMVGLTGMGTPGLQCAPLVRLSTKQSSAMESAIMKPMLSKLTLITPSAATLKNVRMMKVGIGAGSFVFGRSPPAVVVM